MKGFCRVISVILALVMLLSLAACGKAPEQYEETDSGLIPYKTIDGGELSLELLYPTNRMSRKNPTVIVLHGGGWVSGSHEDFFREFEPLITELRENGVTVVGVDYRYALDGLSVRDCIDDCEDALEFLRTHAAQYDIDKNNIGVIGYSAGAHLALMTAIETKDAVKCCVSMSGPTVLSSGHTSDYYSETLAYYCDIALAELDAAKRAKIGPIARLNKRCKSEFLMVNGLADDVVPAAHAEAFCREAESLRLNAGLLTVEGLTHSYASYVEFETLCGKIAAYLSEQFAK